jgi:hypothetical protein
LSGAGDTRADDRRRLLQAASGPWTAAFGLSFWQIGIFVITALLTIMFVQSLTAMMRDWLCGCRKIIGIRPP